VICTGIGLLMVLVATLFFDWQPKEIQIKVLTGLATVVLTMMGFDVLQFIGKRFTNTDYASAKVTPPVNVESAQLVTAGTPEPVKSSGMEVSQSGN
jgi:hypothetical protein